MLPSKCLKSLFESVMFANAMDGTVKVKLGSKKKTKNKKVFHNLMNFIRFFFPFQTISRMVKHCKSINNQINKQKKIDAL